MLQREDEEVLCTHAPWLTRYTPLSPEYVGDSSSPLSLFGFEVGPGWLDLLARTLSALEDELDKVPDEDLEHYAIVQVKEKFGGLSIYLTEGTDAMYDIIDRARAESLRTCEVCGEAGEPQPGGWIKTLCTTCAEDWNNG